MFNHSCAIYKFMAPCSIDHLSPRLMATFNHEQFKCCFENWIAQQHEDLEELLNPDSETTEEQLKILGEKGIKHFEEYQEQRALMAKTDASSFLSPTWCTSFENACLWIGGCRPTLAVRLVYSVCGSELDAQLAEILEGERKGNLADLTSQQLAKVNTLHCKTVKEEDKMSSRMASLQEEIADNPLAMIAKSARRVGESSQGLDRAMNVHSLSLASILSDADMLRISTLKELMSILTPLQNVDLLIATKKLHLSMHEWGKRRDNQLGKPP